ncbi:sulfatase family protein [Flavitalea flava]
MGRRKLTVYKRAFAGVLLICSGLLLVSSVIHGQQLGPAPFEIKPRSESPRPDGSGKDQVRRRPNIIFILSDDHAYQAISAYGSQLVQTPNIDRIAREGALFNRAMVTNSICGPSRACFLTGKYSHVNGYTLNEKKFNTNQAVFPSLLQKSGYQTAWIGKWHLGSLPAAGFDHWNILNSQGEYYNPDFIAKPNDTLRMEGYVTNIITKLSEDWMDRRDTSRPFFLVIGEKATHREWLPDIQDLGAYDDKDFPLPPTFHDSYTGRVAAGQQDMTIEKTMRLKEDLKVHADYTNSGIYNRFTEAQKAPFMAYYEQTVSREFDEKHLTGDALLRWKYERYLKDYLATARSLDRNIGYLLDYLDKKGLTNNTVVIYASDQGFYMGEHGWFDKRFIYEESLRTPFVMRYPRLIKPGTIIDRITLNIDWGPTLLDIAGIRPPADIQGVSFLPLLTGKGQKKVVGLGLGKTAWRKAMYYHYYEFPQPHHVYPHFGIRTEKYKLVRFYGPSDSWELFDLDKDPHELKNLFGTKGMGTLTAELTKELSTLIKQYGDKEAATILNSPILGSPILGSKH